MRYNVNIRYPMDYLFGGTIALASRIAANSAAKNASVVVLDATRTTLTTTLNALLAAGLPPRLPTGELLTTTSGKRKKRLV